MTSRGLSATAELFALLVIVASDLSLRAISFWRNVEASCHINTVVVSHKQQTTPLTSDECYQLATVRRSCVYNTWRLHR